MKIESIIDELINLIKADDYFSKIKVIKAYPCTAAPTRIADETIALGMEEIKLSSASVDDSNRAGDVAVFADIFVPIKASNSRACNIFARLCRCFCSYNILSISAQRITVDVNTASYLLKTVFTFNDEIEVI
ncbi:MAG: hypothetical protein ACI4RF_02930 [Eubacterium sp.]